MIRNALHFALGLVLLACACAGVARAQQDANAADTVGMDWSKVPEYRMVPGDRLMIDMGPKPDASQDFTHEVVIRSDGRITIYPIGDVVAAGLTPMELQRSLIVLLSAALRLPRVTVEVMASAANQVHVMGRVNRPGPAPVLPFMTVSQAIVASGGFADDAARNSVLLIHREGARTVRVTRIPLDRTLKGQSLVDPPVGRFDIVYVPRSTVGNMNLFLRQFFDGMSLMTSTAFTGWELFNLDRVFVTRVVKE